LPGSILVVASISCRVISNRIRVSVMPVTVTRPFAANGASYVLPIDIRAKSEADLKAGGAVDLEVAIEAMKGAYVRLAFFDASRNDRFPSADHVGRALSVRGGLAEMDL